MLLWLKDGRGHGRRMWKLLIEEYTSWQGDRDLRASKWILSTA